MFTWPAAIRWWNLDWERHFGEWFIPSRLIQFYNIWGWKSEHHLSVSGSLNCRTIYFVDHIILCGGGAGDSVFRSIPQITATGLYPCHAAGSIFPIVQPNGLQTLQNVPWVCGLGAKTHSLCSPPAHEKHWIRWTDIEVQSLPKEEVLV